MSRTVIAAGYLFFLCLAAEAAPGFGPKGLARLRLQSSDYISSGQTFFREGAEGSNSSISLGVDTELNWRKFGAKLNLRDEYSGTERWNYLNIYEANIHWRPVADLQFTAGRKLERWSEWETNWRQGLFQPRYLQNKLRSEPAGLTGLFYTQAAGAAAWTLGFLPAHIPDLGAHFSVHDHKFDSNNPWFNSPASNFVFQQVTGDIRYSLDKPGLAEVMNHPGGVGKLEIKAGKNYFARVSAAYKPMPQFLLGFPSRNQVVVTPDEDYMNVRVTPRVAYHALFSHDSVMRLGPWTLAGSVVREVPDHAGSREDFTAQQAVPAWVTSASLSRPLEAEGRYAARARLGFLKVRGGDAPDRGDFATSRTLFERRYQFSEAYMLAFSKPWRGLAFFPLDTELRLIYDRLQNGGVASFSAGMNFTKEFRADLELDFLGLLAGPADVEDGFLALYRANDRIGLGLSYVY